MEKNIVLCVSLASVLIFTLLNSAGMYGADPTILKIVPPPIDVREGEDFTVSINIYDVIDMLSFQFKVSWDTSFLDYVSYTVSPPWQPPVIIPDPIIDETNGYIIIGATSLSATFTGNGALATITFHALKSGVTYVTISEPPLITPDPIVLMTEDATITILPSYTWVSAAGEILPMGLTPLMVGLASSL